MTASQSHPQPQVPSGPQRGRHPRYGGKAKKGRVQKSSSVYLFLSLLACKKSLFRVVQHLEGRPKRNALEETTSEEVLLQFQNVVFGGKSWCYQDLGLRKVRWTSLHIKTKAWSIFHMDRRTTGSFQLTTGHLGTIQSHDGPPERYLQPGSKVLMDRGSLVATWPQVGWSTTSLPLWTFAASRAHVPTFYDGLAKHLHVLLVFGKNIDR